MTIGDVITIIAIWDITKMLIASLLKWAERKLKTKEKPRRIKVKELICATSPLSKHCDICNGKPHANLVVMGIRICLCKDHISEIRDVCHAAVNKEWEVEE